MLQHCVFLRLNPEVTEAILHPILAGLADLQRALPGMVGFEAGPNRDFEAKTPGYTHGFIATFRDAAALQAYADHPEHRALGARLVECCSGGAEGILVFDLDCEGSGRA